MNFYNENDPRMAAWIRELIKVGLIGPGIVDERSIEDVKPEELDGYTQCHFFAGIGGWPLALRLAEWSDDREVWTGSCPCQPFSVAGKAETVGDERHLWPAFHRLIAKRKPPVCFGEQVSGAAGIEWLAGIRVDLEGIGYAVGAADLPAACVGSPHPRQRLFWLADANDSRQERTGQGMQGEGRQTLGFTINGSGLGHTDERGLRMRSEQQVRLVESSGEFGGLSNAARERCGEARPDSERCQERIAGTGEWVGNTERAERGALNSSCGDDRRDVLPRREESSSRTGSTSENGQRVEHAGSAGREERNGAAIAIRSQLRSFADSGAWRDWEIIGFTDGKQRRIESGLKPLVDGLPKELVRLRDFGAPFHPAEARQMRLKGYGNAIVPEVAAEFIRAYLDTL